MAEKVEDSSTSQYLQEGLLALVPVYQKGDAGTIIYTLQGEHEDPRSISWVVKMTAGHYCLDLSRLRRHYSRFLDLRHNISIPLDACLVLLPVKTRRAENQGEVTVGYINLLQVQDILPPRKEPPAEAEPAGGSAVGAEITAGEKMGFRFTYEEDGPTGQTALPPGGAKSRLGPKENALSRVLFKNGLQLNTLNTPETLGERLRQGQRVRRDFLQRRGSGTLYPGLCLEDLLNLLPPCDCALKEFFLRNFTKGG